MVGTSWVVEGTTFYDDTKINDKSQTCCKAGRYTNFKDSMEYHNIIRYLANTHNIQLSTVVSRDKHATQKRGSVSLSQYPMKILGIKISLHIVKHDGDS